MDAQYVRYKWDPNKDAENRRKHDLSLEDGIPALEDPGAQSWIDDGPHEEWRFVTVGVAYPNVLVVITTQPVERTTRIISVRKAEPHEENWYRYGHPEAR
ncbi:MAG TPA: BrnT family toxin [Acidobacteriaceae bacterium]|jgi:hypothetical protein|nr:BrnT family toxin [Acidobacteriaceae bacterium]